MKQHSHYLGKYFGRSSRWSWNDSSTIEIIDIHGLPVALLTDWQTLIFEAADYTYTVESFIRRVRAGYSDVSRIPADLDAIVLAGLDDLVVRLHALDISDMQKTLPPMVASPTTRPNS